MAKQFEQRTCIKFRAKYSKSFIEILCQAFDEDSLCGTQVSDLEQAVQGRLSVGSRLMNIQSNESPGKSQKMHDS